MIEQALKQYFGFDHLRDGQREVIDNILNGQSAAAIFPTGSGKSLCYQLSSVLLPHLTLVISPLLALINDQLNFLRTKGIAAASIDSTQSREQTQQVMRQARSGELKILMISVERLKNERFREFISQVPISLLVVDEAHCISEWGHNFRPDYLKLPNYKAELSIPQVLLLTATATPAVIADMCSKFAIAQSTVTVTGFYRANLHLSVMPCVESQKEDALARLIQQAPTVATIVYVTLQKTAEQVAESLIAKGIQAVAYHAGLKNDLRQNIQQQFMQGNATCIVATIAFGMGVDKADIRRVIHYDLPKSMENYSQEIGRAGRDGLPAQCICLANTEHLNVLENFVYGDTPEQSAIEQVIDEIYSCTEDWEVVLNQLSRTSYIRQLPLKTLLVYLELKGVIASSYSYFASYRFKLIKSVDAIVSQFSGERQTFVRAIFNSAIQARTWYSLDFEQLWHHSHSPRHRVVAALDYFHENGWIELQTKQSTDVYKVVNRQMPRDALTEEIFQLFKQKEQSEISRIHAMVAFFQSSQCLSFQLAQYFSDENAPRHCGQCSVCKGRIAKLEPPHLPAVTAAQIKIWLQPFISACPNSVSSDALTRYLCGITHPLNSELKANKMAGFARLERYPFQWVKNQVDELLTHNPFGD
ncbi:RecQ family ATP-dependent DNA helicase [Celerinatantimonas diazotrophica]|uniref:ATP-dependent DNA helicase RecQ n=1 Tax=Celerinatantimonas diazotrophica TaxID=412034 RepID=A0A4R1K6A3_9GAMM|nr:RecQ family ATP-dependent DNA helicase [Celerinatantimonas diazotrophica]TCK58589.1 RecQ-like ATP-dependent DNA helicase [Celerinatantimonas diazotrophica]CAG9297218.1 ATP-dependent RNA helicase DeaD [Celerinatantimonas diazotrophica]